MAITELQRSRRSRGIGSSDAAAILGYSPWKNAADVRLEKLGLLAGKAEGFDAELADLGTHLEDGIARAAEVRLNCRLVRPTATYVHESGVLYANVDRQVERAARGAPICEVKDSGLDEDWGEPGTIEVPPYVLCQCAHQLLCVGSELAHVARLSRGFRRGLFMYRIEIEAVAELMRIMAEYLPSWHERHVIQGKPVEEVPHYATLARIARVPVCTKRLDDAKVLDWRRWEEELKRVEEARDVAKSKVVADLELPDGTHAEGGISEFGAVTYFEQAMKEHVRPASRSRVLRFKPQQRKPK